MTKDITRTIALMSLGALLAIVVCVPITYQAANRSGMPKEQSLAAKVSLAPKIIPKNAEAFGLLAYATGSDANTLSASPVGLGGGGMQTAAADGQAEAADKLVPNIAVGEPFPGGEIIQYSYSYAGDDLNLTDISDSVYRQNLGIELGSVGGGLTRANLNVIDLGSFNDLELQSFSVKQTDKNGYAIYVDPLNGMVSISGNEGIWAYPTGEYVPFTEDQVMSHDELVTVANNFLLDYRIDIRNYGAPVVDDRGLMYALSQPAEFRYIPEVMTVTYPLLLDGQPTYTGDGSAYGLYVMINMRTKQVASLTLNVAESYDKSSYELERDTHKILGLAAQGGLYNYASPYESNTKTVTIELGTPEVILMNHYNYTGSTSESLFIPALKFPITKNDPGNPVYSDAVVVPLAKSVIEQANQEPAFRIMEDTHKVDE